MSFPATSLSKIANIESYSLYVGKLEGIDEKRGAFARCDEHKHLDVPNACRASGRNLCVAIDRDYRRWNNLPKEDALYVANLIHRDSRAVIKVVRFGLNIQCFPDEHAVKLVERQIVQQWKKRLDDEE